MRGLQDVAGQLKIGSWVKAYDYRCETPDYGCITAINREANMVRVQWLCAEQSEHNIVPNKIGGDTHRTWTMQLSSKAEMNAFITEELLRYRKNVDSARSFLESTEKALARFESRVQDMEDLRL